MFSSCKHVDKLSLGKLHGWKKEMNRDTKPCETYYDKSGKKCFKGTRFLKATETLAFNMF